MKIENIYLGFKNSHAKLHKKTIFQYLLRIINHSFSSCAQTTIYVIVIKLIQSCFLGGGCTLWDTFFYNRSKK